MFIFSLAPFPGLFCGLTGLSTDRGGFFVAKMTFYYQRLISRRSDDWFFHLTDGS
jgi:hypothetical protein